jgi:malonate transporter
MVAIPLQGPADEIMAKIADRFRLTYQHKMSPLTETVLLVFGLIALGYLAGWSGYLKAEIGDGLSQFAVGVAVPLLLFRTMVAADFHGTAPCHLWGTYFAAVIVAWTAGNLVTTRLFGRDSALGVVGGVGAAFSNMVLVGVPFMLGVYGQDGIDVLSLLVSIHLPTMMMASIVMFELFGARGRDPDPPLVLITGFLRKIIANPLIVGILAGLAWRVTGLPLPGLAVRFVDALADIAGPLALFAVGLGLRKFGISGNVRLALALSGLKLLLLPAAALCFAWLFGLPPLSAKVAVLTAALPAGINSYLIAVQFGTGEALASNQMTISTGFAVVTMTFWVSIAAMVFG